jgi:anaerobic magnesium-protoporphyrin IX monomethyl ester cyclase
VAAPSLQVGGGRAVKTLLIVARCPSPKQTYREYPLGVGMIATALRRRGHEAAVFDQAAENADDRSLRAYVRQYAPEAVGFSVVTPNYPTTQRLMRWVREDCPGALILAGGVHATLFPEDLLDDGADAVALGEGVKTTVALLQSGRDRRRWRDLPGLVFRSRGGRAVRTPAAILPAADDVDDIDREVYNLPLYTHHSMLASLGCPYRCTFCCNYSGMVLNRRPRSRPHERIIREMRLLADRHRADRVFFADDVFLLRRSDVLAFCRELAAQALPVRWIAQMRADAIDPEVAEHLAAAGCRRVYLGVESGSEAILRRVRKGIDKESIRLAVRSAAAAGIRVKTGWIFGLPGTPEEQAETIPFLRELRPDEVSIHYLVPFPGTDYYRHPEKHGIRIRDPRDFRSFSYGGLSDNFAFDYVSHAQLAGLVEQAVDALESDGYTSSDRATAPHRYVFSTPFCASPMRVFPAQEEGLPCPST